MRVKLGLALFGQVFQADRITININKSEDGFNNLLLTIGLLLLLSHGHLPNACTCEPLQSLIAGNINNALAAEVGEARILLPVLSEIAITPSIPALMDILIPQDHVFPLLDTGALGFNSGLSFPTSLVDVLGINASHGSALNLSDCALSFSISLGDQAESLFLGLSPQVTAFARDIPSITRAVKTMDMQLSGLDNQSYGKTPATAINNLRPLNLPLSIESHSFEGNFDPEVKTAQPVLSFYPQAISVKSPSLYPAVEFQFEHLPSLPGTSSGQVGQLPRKVGASSPKTSSKSESSENLLTPQVGHDPSQIPEPRSTIGLFLSTVVMGLFLKLKNRK